MSYDKLDVMPPELRAFAAKHRVTDEQLRQWASEDGTFPQGYLQTHGIANYATYSKLLTHYLTRRIAGDTFAQANQSTATAVDTSANIFIADDRGGAARFTGVPGA